MPLLTITNLTTSTVALQEPTGVYGFVLTLPPSGAIVDKAMTLNELASIEPVLRASAAAGRISWGVADDPDSAADLGGPIAAFDHVDIVKYVRAHGSDEGGDGTLTNPFRTVERGIRAFNPVIPPGKIYRLDATGSGTQTLPEMYEFPVFVGAEGIGDFDFSQKYFHYYNAVNIQGDPQVATGVTGITSIPLAGSTVTVPKANTELKRITHTGAGWVAGALKGKFAVGAGLATEHGVIWDNGTNYIDVTVTTTPTFPITIMEPSFELVATKDPADLHRAAVNIKSTPIALLGAKVRSLSAAAGQFGGWGLQTAGSLPISIQLCHIEGAGFVTKEWTRVRQSYLPNALFMMAPNMLTQCYIHRSLEVVTGGPRVTVWGTRGVDSLFRKTVIEECSTVRFRDLFDTHESAPLPYCQFNLCQFINMLGDFPPVLGTINDGIYWTGAHLDLFGVDLTRTAADPLHTVGNAIRVRGNGATVRLRGVTGTGWALGVLVEDGAHAVQDDAGGAATTLGSAVGANSFKSGSTSIEAAWPTAVYPANGSSITDYSNQHAQGTRVWRRS